MTLSQKLIINWWNWLILSKCLRTINSYSWEEYSILSGSQIAYKWCPRKHYFVQQFWLKLTTIVKLFSVQAELSAAPGGCSSKSSCSKILIGFVFSSRELLWYEWNICLSQKCVWWDSNLCIMIIIKTWIGYTLQTDQKLETNFQNVLFRGIRRSRKRL